MLSRGLEVSFEMSLGLPQSFVIPLDSSSCLPNPSGNVWSRRSRWELLFSMLCGGTVREGMILYFYKVSNRACHCLPDEKTFVPQYPYLENEDYNNSCVVGLRLR